MQLPAQLTALGEILLGTLQIGRRKGGKTILSVDALEGDGAGVTVTPSAAAPDNSLPNLFATQPRSFRNRLRNPGFTVNQRAVSGTVTLAAGQHGHDGFKAGAGGCTYTFAKAGGVTTITITAGTLVQVIEGSLYLPEGGQYTLSWLGTAQARINGGAYAASPITVAGLTAEANATVEWGTGTLALPMFEPGTKRTVFEYRDDELRRCQRYFQSSYNAGVAPGTPNIDAAFNSQTNGSPYGILGVVTFPARFRANPTVTFYSFKTGAPGKLYNGTTQADVDGYTQTLTRDFVTVALFNVANSAGQFVSTVYTASAEL